MMNERIRELYKEATGKDWAYDFDTQIAEKFAELIVKKFDDILLLQQLDCIGNHDKKSAELIEQIRDKTKTFFRS
jgi:hypothetical protein